MAALGAAGCGGDDPLTEEEFLAQGNEICTTGNAELETAAQEAFDEGAQPSQEEQDAFITDTVIPNIQGQLDDLGELEAPDDVADQLDSVLEEAQSILDEAAEDPSGFFSGSGDPFASVNDDLTEIGLEACAS